MEQVASDEMVMEDETVENNRGPTKENKEFQQPSKEVDTNESSGERDSDYDNQFDDLPDTKDVIFGRRGMKILFLEKMILTTYLMILTVILKIMNVKWL